MNDWVTFFSSMVRLGKELYPIAEKAVSMFSAGRTVKHDKSKRHDHNAADQHLLRDGNDSVRAVLASKDRDTWIGVRHKGNQPKSACWVVQPQSGDTSYIIPGAPNLASSRIVILVEPGTEPMLILNPNDAAKRRSVVFDEDGIPHIHPISVSTDTEPV